MKQKLINHKVCDPHNICQCAWRYMQINENAKVVVSFKTRLEL